MREIKFKSIDTEPKMEKIIQIDSSKYRQFTGLLDKSGKEIYEGDIVRNDLDELSSVRYSGAMFLWDEFTKGHGDTDMIEVIGNIYENRNLLTQSSQDKV